MSALSQLRLARPSPSQRRATRCAASGGGGGNRNAGGGGGGGSGGSGEPGDSQPRRSGVLAVATLAAAALVASPARAAKKKTPPPPPPPVDPFNLDFAKQFSASAGLSGVVGFASGLLVKVLAGGALVCLAAVFALLKWCEQQRLITVNWKNVNEFVVKQTKFLDVNKDGKIDLNDARMVLSRFEGFMATTVPSAAGFCVGFALGIKP